MRVKHLLAGVLAAAACGAGVAAEWDTIRGEVATLEPPGDHHFLLKGDDKAYVVDGDEGEVEGTITLSMFSPATAPHADAGMVYSYGSFYTRTYYGDRTDVVLMFDLETLRPAGEVEIPPKSAGIGHSGMIGLIDERFVGVWNITPAMSVSMVDVQERTFVEEISTPGCAAVYPIGRGFVQPCGDGAMQYISLSASGEESSRVRSERFFDVEVDPVFDYAVRAGDDWLFMSLEGTVWRVGVEGGALRVEEVMSIFEDEEEAEAWRIGGAQPFAYNDATGLLVTLMHQGGGQETFEDAGTEVWAFSMGTGGRRGYREELEAPARRVQLTNDAQPLLVVAASEDGHLYILDALTGQSRQTMNEVGGGLVQPLR